MEKKIICFRIEPEERETTELYETQKKCNKKGDCIIKISSAKRIMKTKVEVEEYKRSE